MPSVNRQYGLSLEINVEQNTYFLLFFFNRMQDIITKYGHTFGENVSKFKYFAVKCKMHQV